jgi:hypothetical protein
MSEQASSWLSETRDKLGGQSASIAAALDDLAATLGDQSDRAPATWVDLRHGEHVAVYVLTSALLHRFAGEPDPRPQLNAMPHETRKSACEYRTFPITRNATFSLSVKVTMAGTGTSGTTERKWKFRLPSGPDVEEISLATPSRSPTSGESADPTTFARALTEAIAAAAAAPGIP